jgi:hypothetical protein
MYIFIFITKTYLKLIFFSIHILYLFLALSVSGFIIKACTPGLQQHQPQA